MEKTTKINESQATTPTVNDNSVKVTSENKRQPWKDFFQLPSSPQGPTSSSHVPLEPAGNDLIRLTAELDDKDIGG